MVRSNDLLAGAAPDDWSFVNSRSVGEARSAAPTVRIQRTGAAAAADSGPLE